VNAALAYTRFEILRTFRNGRFFVFSLGFPLVLYYVIAGPNKGDNDFGGSGISAPTYYMIGLAAFGGMNAVLAAGARIAAERGVGWNRQLRITPLSVRAYFRAKVLTGYLMALVTLLLLYAAGATLGVRLPAGRWLEMTGLMLVGLVPFVALGILYGHLLTSDSIGPAMGGTTALLALLGGTWFPITSGALHTVAQALPSFWLVQASRVSISGHAWGGKGWLIMAGWSVVLGLLAARAYARDTQRV
jgi:ABC-2 type transport system permease protein